MLKEDVLCMVMKLSCYLLPGFWQWEIHDIPVKHFVSNQVFETAGLILTGFHPLDKVLALFKRKEEW